MKLETLEAIQKLNMDTIRFEEDSEDQVTVVFTDKEVKTNLENIALGEFNLEDTEANRESGLAQLFDAVFELAAETAKRDVPEFAKTEKMKNDN